MSYTTDAGLQANAMLRAKKLLARYTALMTAHNKKPGLPRAVLLGGNVYGVKELQYDGPTVQRWLDDVQEEAVQHIRAAFDTEASFGIGSCGSVFMPKDEYFKGKRTRLCLEDRGDHIFLMLDATFCINFVYPPESASSSNRVPATPPASSSDDEALTASPKVKRARIGHSPPRSREATPDDTVPEHDFGHCDNEPGQCRECCNIEECTTKDGRSRSLEMCPGQGVDCNFCIATPRL